MSCELDARVAEEVMGFEIKSDLNGEACLFFTMAQILDPSFGIGRFQPLIRCEGGCLYFIPAYSTDMNAAMEVANKILERKPACFSLEWTPDGDHHWFAVFIMDGKDTSSWAYGDADTPAMAICLAAREAVGNG